MLGAVLYAVAYEGRGSSGASHAYACVQVHWGLCWACACGTSTRRAAAAAAAAATACAACWAASRAPPSGAWTRWRSRNWLAATPQAAGESEGGPQGAGPRSAPCVAGPAVQLDTPKPPLVHTRVLCAQHTCHTCTSHVSYVHIARVICARHACGTQCAGIHCRRCLSAPCDQNVPLAPASHTAPHNAQAALGAHMRHTHITPVTRPSRTNAPGAAHMQPHPGPRRAPAGRVAGSRPRGGGTAAAGHNTASGHQAAGAREGGVAAAAAGQGVGI